MFFTFLIAVLAAASGHELTDSENCVANAIHEEDCVVTGSPLLQRAVIKQISSHGDKRDDIHFEGFVLDDSARRGYWESIWDMDVTGLSMLDPIRPDDKMLNDSLNDGTISRRYTSWYMPIGPSSGEEKFYHEVGVAMAHRKAWETLIERANGDNNRWALILEGDANLGDHFWSWVRYIKEGFLSKGNAPFMIYLGHCYEACYGQRSASWRDGDFCLRGNETNNPHNVSGCMVHFSEALCPTAYLISYEGAKKMMEVTIPMQCAIDEKLRYEIHRNNWDARIMCGPLVKQPWQIWPVGYFSRQPVFDISKNVCGPPGDSVRSLQTWP